MWRHYAAGTLMKSLMLCSNKALMTLFQANSQNWNYAQNDIKIRQVKWQQQGTQYSRFALWISSSLVFNARAESLACLPALLPTYKWFWGFISKCDSYQILSDPARNIWQFCHSLFLQSFFLLWENRINATICYIRCIWVHWDPFPQNE